MFFLWLMNYADAMLMSRLHHVDTMQTPCGRDAHAILLALTNKPLNTTNND